MGSIPAIDVFSIQIDILRKLFLKPEDARHAVLCARTSWNVPGRSSRRSHTGMTELGLLFRVQRESP